MMPDIYGYSKSDWALKEIFDCGLCDLSIIDDSGVDINEYIDSTDKENISLANFVDYVVRKADKLLKDEWAKRKEDILSDVEERHQENIKEYGEDYMEEFSEEDDVQTIFFYKEKADDIIKKGLNCYFNFLDTHVSIPYAYELDRYNLLDEVNDLIGFTSVTTGIEK